MTEHFSSVKEEESYCSSEEEYGDDFAKIFDVHETGGWRGRDETGGWRGRDETGGWRGRDSCIGWLCIGYLIGYYGIRWIVLVDMCGNGGCKLQAYDIWMHWVIFIHGER